MEFKHPKYYKELRKRNTEAVAKSGISSHASLESDQVISPRVATASARRAPGPGQQQQASSAKLKEPQASSGKHQAPSSKRQA